MNIIITALTLHDVMSQRRVYDTHQILGGDGISPPTGGYDHLSQALPHILQAAGEGEHRHDFAGHSDVKLGLEDTTVQSCKAALKLSLLNQLSLKGSTAFCIFHDALWYHERNLPPLENNQLYLSCVSLFSGRLADSDLPQESIIGIQHWSETEGHHKYLYKTHNTLTADLLRRRPLCCSYLSAR